MLVTGSAIADTISPEESACTGKKAGDSCTVTGSTVAGNCASKKCKRLDYSDGSPPGTIEYDCMECVTTEAADASPPTDGGDTTADASTTPAAKSGGCHVGEASPMAALPWLVALAFPLVMRRRRQDKQ